MRSADVSSSYPREHGLPDPAIPSHVAGMKASTIASILVATFAAGPAAGGQDPATLDRAVALKADVETLARDALLAIAPRFVEVERPTFSGRGPGGPVRSLQFATAAQSAGWPGLCKATTVWIDLVDRHAPVRTSTVYKIVGDLEPLPDMWNEAYGAELERKCADAGRVIPTESGDLGQAVFFSLQEGDQDHIWSAARALQLAISYAAAGAGVACVGDEPGYAAEMPDGLDGLAPDDPEVVEDRENRDGCKQAASTLAGLSLDRLRAIDVAPCADAGAGVFCLEAEFLRYAYFNRRVGWMVTLRYRDAPDRHRDDLLAVEALALKPSWTVYD